MATVDSLDIQIAASAQKANDAINGLIKNLKRLSNSLNIDTSSLEKIGKSINVDNISKSIKRQSKEITKSASQAAREFQDKFKNISVKVDFSKPEAELKKFQKQAQTAENALSRIMVSSSADKQIKGIEKWSISLAQANNAVSILENHLAEMRESNKKVDFTIERPNDSHKYLIEYKKELKDIGKDIEAITGKFGGVSNIPRSNIEVLLHNLKLSAEEVKKSYPQATNVISAFDTEIGRLQKTLEKPLGSQSKITFDTNGIAESEKKVSKLGEEADKSDRKINKLKPSISGFSRHSSNAASVANSFGKNIKKLSSSMDGLNKFAKKASSGMKSFTKQALSAIGISFGLYESVKGIKNAVENSMNYVETLNYFNAAFQQVAENADLSGWKEAGYESAEVYADSFKERAKQLTQKLTGFEVSDTGELTRTSMPSLGLDPDKTMQYQATFAQMASSMGTTSDAALKVSNALTMIGADLASVRNLDFEKVWEDMASGLAGMSRTLDKYGANIRNVNLQQKLNSLGIDESITKINQQDKALLRTIILLESTKYAWGDLALTINNPSNQLRLLRSNFQSLSRTIGSLFIPTITKVLPYINAMVIALQRLFAWVGKVLGIKLSDFNASIGGMPDAASGLVDMEDGADGAADAVDKTTDSVKELEKSLSVLSFDELHQLSAPAKAAESDNDKDENAIPDYSDILGNALDNALSDYQSAWDKAFSEMSNKANEIADKIVKAVKEAWEKADFSDIGNTFGTKIKTALDNIPWDGIQDVAAKIGKSIATFINGAVEVAGLGYTLGNTIAQLINTALIGIESFSKNLHWESVGRFIGDGINGALGNINWKTALSAAKHMGSGIGRAVNSFMARTDFSLVGKTVANAINTAIQFALSAGTTIDFKTFGKKISDAINGFFKTFDAKKAAKAINAWLIGALSAASTMLKNTDFNAIGRKIGEFLVGIDLTEAIKGLASTVWEAIKGAFGMISSVFSEAPLEASLISAFAILKFTGLGKKVAGNIALSIGNSIESSMVNSGFATNLQTGIAEAATGAVAAFAEFSVIKGVFSDLNSLSDITIEDIGKIAGAATAAGTVMTAVFGFPAGVIATALAGVAGAIEGTRQKVDELAETSMWETFSNNGDVAVSALIGSFNNFAESVSQNMAIANEKINSIQETHANIESTSKKIESIKGAIEIGAYSVEEKVPEITEKFGELLTSTQSIFSQEYDLIVEGLAGSLGDTLTAAGVSVPELTTLLTKVRDSGMEMAQGISEELKNLDKAYENGEISADEYARKQTELYEKLNSLKIDASPAEEAGRTFDTLKGKVNFSEWVKDGSLNTAAVDEMLSSMETSFSTAKESVNTNIDGTKKALEDFYNYAVKNNFPETDIKKIADAIAGTESERETQLTTLSGYFTDVTNTLQTEALQKIPEVINQASKDYEKLNPAQQLFVGGKEKYIQEAIERYQENVVDPLNERIQSGLTSIGSSSSAFASKKGKEIADSLFDKLVGYEYEGDTEYTNLKKDAEKIVNNSLSGIPEIAESSGKDAGKNYAVGTQKGIDEDAKSATDAAGRMATSVDNKVVEKWDEHSPSVVAKGHGMNYAQGIANGISQNTPTVTVAATKLAVSVKNIFPKYNQDFYDLGKTYMSKFSKGIESHNVNIGGTIRGIVREIKRILSGYNQDFHNLGSGISSKLVSGISSKSLEAKNAAGGIATNIKNALSIDLSSAGKSVAQSFVDGLKSVYIPTPHIDYAGSNTQWFGDAAINIPYYNGRWYAKGGLFSGASVIGVGEAGPEAVLPLSNTQAMSQIAESIYANAPENGATGLDKEEIKQAVIEGMVTAMMMNSKNLTPVVNCYATLKTENDEVLARAVARGQNSLNYRLSPT